MNSNLEANQLAQPNRVSVAWPSFQSKLAVALGNLEEDQFLVLSVKRSERFVQFAAQGSFGMRAETVSNDYLDEPERLDEGQVSTMIEAGWHAPTRSPDDSTPQDDPDGSPNFFTDFPVPVSFEAIAKLTVRTLTDVLRVPHPGFLEYKAFDADGEPIALPELGLKLARSGSQADNQQDLSQLLLATLAETTGIGNLDFDDDGDVGIRSGSALAFVRLLDNPPQVRIFSPILRNVEEPDGVLARLNEFNARETLMRFTFRNGSIFGEAHISAAPFVSAHVAQAIVHFCGVADGMGCLLQREFGGRTSFGESMPSLLKH